jgi:hypothetical protein
MYSTSRRARKGRKLAPEHKANIAKTMSKVAPIRSADPKWRKKNAECNRVKARTLSWRVANLVAVRKKCEKPEFIELMTQVNRRTCASKKWKASHAKAAKKEHE